MRRTQSLAPRQRGVAALELALLLPFFLLLLGGLLAYGSLFWAQQRLSHAAGEGAKAALEIAWQQWPYQDANGTALSANYIQQVQRAVNAAGRGVTGVQSRVALHGAGAESCPQTSGVRADCLTVVLSLPSQDWPVLGVMAGLAAALGGQSGCAARFAQGAGRCWIPPYLYAQATVRLRRH